MTAPFPKASLITTLRARTRSLSDGDPFTALADALEEHWNKITTGWERREDDDGLKNLGATILRVTKACDQPNMVSNRIRLRDTFATYDFDIYVCAIVGRTILETLAGSTAQAKDLIRRIAAEQEYTAPYDFTFLANLMLADICLDEDDHDGAMAALQRNIEATQSPTSQYLMYLATRAATKAGGQPIGTSVFAGDISDRFCSRPFDSLSTGNGRVLRLTPTLHACSCSGTLPYPLGGQDVDDAWNGTVAQEIRRSVLDGDFTYCNRVACNVIKSGELPKRDQITDPWLRDIIDNHKTKIDRAPASVSLGHDPSCNIACPSCRVELVKNKSELQEDYRHLNDNILLPLMEGAHVTLFVAIDGDPFYSKSYRHLLENLDPEKHGGVHINFLTNGLLLTPQTWEWLSHVQHLVQHVGVSIDGAEKETYEDLRRPGKWETITANMEFLSTLRQDGKIGSLGMQFVVQQKNYAQMAEFVRLGKKWTVDKITFIRIFNFGSFDTKGYQDSDVANSLHPEHEALLDILASPVFEDPMVDFFTMTPIAEKARERRKAQEGLAQGSLEQEEVKIEGGGLVRKVGAYVCRLLGTTSENSPRS